MPTTEFKLQRLLVFWIIPLTVACSRPRIDSTNLDKSAAKVRRSLDEVDRLRFDEALALTREVQMGEVPGSENVEIDGMSGLEVLAEAERIGLRREIAWVEEKIAYHQGLLAEDVRLANLKVKEIGIVEKRDKHVRLRMRLHNETGESLGSGFVRLGLDLRQGRELQTEEFVTFRPPLQPGETRNVEAGVSSDFSWAFFSTPGSRVTARFTSLERGGEVLATDPGPAALMESRAALEEAQRELAGLTERLKSVN